MARCAGAEGDESAMYVENWSGVVGEGWYVVLAWSSRRKWHSNEWEAKSAYLEHRPHIYHAYLFIPVPLF